MSDFLGLVGAFIMVLTFGVMFQAPKKSLFLLGVTGTLSWAGFLISQLWLDNVVISVFIASVIVGFSGEIFARLMRLPVTVFIIAGIIPLVPGITAYDTMLYLIKGQYIEGVRAGLDTGMIAGAIAFAVAVVGALAKSYKSTYQQKTAPER